jgi:RNA polymerase sigma-70 factor (sigma-E family)
VSAEREFDVFVAARQPLLFRTALLLCSGDAAAAADAVQNTMIELWRRWPRVAAMEKIDGYAHKVLTSQVLRGTRGALRLVSTSMPPDRGVADPAASADERRDMWAALGQLPTVQRAVIVLRYYEDLTEAQTAESLGISVGTVKSHSSRALSAMRRHLEPNSSARSAP